MRHATQILALFFVTGILFIFQSSSNEEVGIQFQCNVIYQGLISMAGMEMLKLFLNGPCQVIRSTVSLCFVLQIDEGLYSAVVPESRKKVLESMQFGVEEPQRAGNGPGVCESVGHSRGFLC